MISTGFRSYYDILFQIFPTSCTGFRISWGDADVLPLVYPGRLGARHDCRGFADSSRVDAVHLGRPLND